jgi:hypothetical protein
MKNKFGKGQNAGEQGRGIFDMTAAVDQFKLSNKSALLSQLSYLYIYT